jgi:hypothetical protein
LTLRMSAALMRMETACLRLSILAPLPLSYVRPLQPLADTPAGK